MNFKVRDTLLLFLLTLFGIGGLFSIQAQQANVQEPYLLDSIRVDLLSSMDKQILDSIIPLYKKDSSYESRLRNLSYISENTWSIHVWPLYNRMMYELAEEALRSDPGNRLFLRFKGDALNNIGFFHKEKENPKLALKYYHQALDIALEIQDDSLEATCYNNLGYVYHHMLGAPAKALSYYSKSLALDKKNEDRLSYSVSLANIGSIHASQNDTVKALQNFTESLKIKMEEGDMEGEARLLTYIAELELKKGDLDAALSSSQRSLEMDRKLGFERGVSENLILIGEVYDALGVTDSSLKYYGEAMRINLSIDNKTGYADALFYIGQHYYGKGINDSALTYVTKAHELYKETGFVEDVVKSSSMLSRIYETIGNYRLGLKYYQDYTYHDSLLNNKESERRLVREALQAEFDKKELEINQQKQVAEERSANRLIILIISVICLIVVIGLLVFLYSRFNLIREQKDVILKQQTLLEYKNKDLNIKNKQVSDSINYAQYIAQTIFPAKETLDTNFKEHFVFFKPKDIVSGDFYWAHQIDQHRTVLVVADCTGHGVPGAMLSLICASLLDQVVIQNNILEPNLILDQFYEQLIAKINRHSKEDKVNDGVEMSVCFYDKEKGKLLFSASYHKMYLVDKGELKEFAGDKIQIRKENFVSGNEFTQYELQPSEGSMVYMFSDGFVDQKGGPNKKKYFYPPFREFLISISDKPMEEQKSTLEKEFVRWRGSVDQYDDILIFGIRF